jgi:hypothetical protein
MQILSEGLAIADGLTSEISQDLGTFQEQIRPAETT